MDDICNGCQYENDEVGCAHNHDDCRVIKRALKSFKVKEEESE